MTSLVPLQAGALAPLPVHGLGDVADDWAAVEVWLAGVAANSVNGSQETVNTYRYHMAKLRWFCERQIGKPPSRWTQQEVHAFIAFLEKLPEHAVCARANGRPDGPFVAAGLPGHTPFRKTPSASSRADIVRCVHALFNAFHAAGYIRLNPMQALKARKARRLNTSRAVDLDLYAYVLQHMALQPRETPMAHQLYERDRFALIALRELGLRASELVGAAMRDVQRLSDPKSGKTYWVFYVREENAKGGAERTIPMTNAAMDGLMSYRRAFGLSALPDAGDGNALLLSPRTRPVALGNAFVKSAQDRRFFGAWGSIASRKTLYRIVKQRLGDTAAALRGQQRQDEADALEQASPHWLRHTFAKASLLRGRDIRSVAKALGHASVTTTMVYTEQTALDLIREYESGGGGEVARG